LNPAQSISHHHQEKQRNQRHVEVTVGDGIEIDWKKNAAMNTFSLRQNKTLHRVDLTMVAEEVQKSQPREEMN
jgi:hypothetical protein